MGESEHHSILFRIWGSKGPSKMPLEVTESARRIHARREFIEHHPRSGGYKPRHVHTEPPPDHDQITQRDTHHTGASLRGAIHDTGYGPRVDDKRYEGMTAHEADKRGRYDLWRKIIAKKKG